MGHYVNNNLFKGEEVVYEAKYHWRHFISLRGLLSLFILPWIDTLVDEFVITNRRVIVKRGWIGRNTFEMNISKVETVLVHQSISGRVLNYGNLIIIGSGGTKEYLFQISRPLDFRRNFQSIEGQ